ncbi:MAG: AbrB/MazE/SpoVT family DNA-binding domain-containing protein [Christensenellaceae bacterium]
MLEVTKVSSKGQVTIPIELRKKLNLTAGGKLAFIEGDDGNIYVVNSSLLALRTIQQEMSGQAKKAGLTNENDVVAYIKEMRKGK